MQNITRFFNKRSRIVDDDDDNVIRGDGARADVGVDEEVMNEVEDVAQALAGGVEEPGEVTNPADCHEGYGNEIPLGPFDIGVYQARKQAGGKITKKLQKKKFNFSEILGSRDLIINGLSQTGKWT